MAFFQIEAANQLLPIAPTTFQLLGLKERQDMQALLRNHSAAIDPEILIVAEEFGNWQESSRRVDLLGLDKKANLIVIELKRVEEGGHMELQALRYAAMLSTVDFPQVVEAYAKLLKQLGKDADAAERLLLDFLELTTAEEASISNTPRIILMAPSFSLEMTTAVLWLNERGLDIRCLAVIVYEVEKRRFLDVEQLIPLQSAADYMVRKRAKEVKAEKQAVARKDRTSWLSLLDNGTLNPGSILELIKLPKNILPLVPENERLAEVLAEPKGQVRWLTDGNTYYISGLCAVICEKFATGVMAPKYPFDGPAYWARQYERTSLAELARTQPLTSISGD